MNTFKKWSKVHSKWPNKIFNFLPERVELEIKHILAYSASDSRPSLKTSVCNFFIGHSKILMQFFFVCLKSFTEKNCLHPVCYAAVFLLKFSCVAYYPVCHFAFVSCCSLLWNGMSWNKKKYKKIKKKHFSSPSPLFRQTASGSTEKVKPIVCSVVAPIFGPEMVNIRIAK